MRKFKNILRINLKLRFTKKIIFWSLHIGHENYKSSLKDRTEWKKKHRQFPLPLPLRTLVLLTNLSLLPCLQAPPKRASLNYRFFTKQYVLYFLALYERAFRELSLQKPVNMVKNRLRLSRLSNSPDRRAQLIS